MMFIYKDKLICGFIVSSVRLLRWKFLCEDQLTLKVRGGLLCSSFSKSIALGLVTSTQQKRAWLHNCPAPSCVYSQSPLMIFPWAFSSPGWQVPAPSAFPHMEDVSVPLSSQWSFAGCSPVCPCFSRTEEPRTGHSSPGVASSVLSLKDHPPPSAGNSSNAAHDAISLLWHKGTPKAVWHEASGGLQYSRQLL